MSIKLETVNPVRSFKARGTEVVASLLADAGSPAVVCGSAGNLGQALAWSGRARGLEVTVVASRFAPAVKLDRIRALGARLELVDGDSEMARVRAAAIARHDGIGPGAPAMTRSWRQRRVVTTDSVDTIADAVAGRCPIPEVLDDLLLVGDDAVLVQEASIIAGMRVLLKDAGLIVEPSAALGIAAILEDRDRFADRHVVTIVCGSNVDLDAYHRWVGAGTAGPADS